MQCNAAFCFKMLCILCSNFALLLSSDPSQLEAFSFCRFPLMSFFYTNNGVCSAYLLLPRDTFIEVYCVLKRICSE